ncbi:MAG: carboxypeptidase regulatory-like domain-containing protein [Hyphomicrobiales bacterium]|nr:MAG: carboxypeptidase regulatory-like domain-containing protein [Hyphomicrobiales bacterium]
MLNLRPSIISALTALLVLLSCLPARAQLQTGNVFGTVTDQQGLALPGVLVTITGAGAPQVQVTNERGQFRFLGLSPSSYSLDAALEGFLSASYPNVALNVGRNTQIELVLTPEVEDEMVME